MSLFNLYSEGFSQLEARLRAQDTQLRALQVAYNAFFDAVAEDLGYQAHRVTILPSYYGPGQGFTTVSDPRQLAERITPEKRKIIRNPTARCRKQKRKGGKP